MKLIKFGYKKTNFITYAVITNDNNVNRIIKEVIDYSEGAYNVLDIRDITNQTFYFYTNIHEPILIKEVKENENHL